LGSNGTENSLKSLSDIIESVSWVAEWAQFSPLDGFRHRECIPPKQIDVVKHKRGQPSDILGMDGEAFPGQLVHGGFYIQRIPEHDDVEDQAQCAKLVFLSFPIALP
jgi:hypothetical protein